MPLFGFKRHQTRYGQILQPRGQKEGHLLITEHGKKMLLDYRRLLGSVLVEAVGATDNVTFSRNVRHNLIGQGAHGLVYTISPSKEMPFTQRHGTRDIPVRNLVLKVYRKSVAREQMPGGFTQFVALSAIYNYLKRRRRPHFVVRPVSFHFVSNEIIVRDFVNAPTLEELKESFVDKRVRRRPLSLVFTDEQIEEFRSKHRITKQFLEKVEQDLLNALAEGQKENYNTRLQIVHDPTIKNFFVMGRDANGKAIITVIDQGKKPIRDLGEQIIKGIVF